MCEREKLKERESKRAPAASRAKFDPVCVWCVCVFVCVRACVCEGGKERERAPAASKAKFDPERERERVSVSE